MSETSARQAPSMRPAFLGPPEAEAVARDAIMFAYPMLFNYKTIWEQTQDYSSSAFIGGFNRYRHYTRSYTSADTDIVTPNNDSPYSWAWFDLRREPVVLRVPEVAEDRYYVVQMFDLFTFNFAYVGVRKTGFDSGDYLIASEGWNGDPPDGISDVLRSETEIAGTLTRTALFGAQDMPNVRAIQHGYAIQPLSEYAGLRPPPPVSAPVFPAWQEDRALSAGFIGYLNFLLSLVDLHPGEAALYERFAGLGIGAGQPWRPEDTPPAVLAAIEAGVKQGLADIDEKAAHTTSSLGLFGSRKQLGDDYLTRAVAANMGIYGQVAEEAVYGGSRLDASGEQLIGGRSYTLHFDTSTLPDAKFFWSITLYKLPSRLLAENPIDRYSIGDRTPGISYGDDGSLDITLQATQPTDATERANWLPTPTEGPFTVIYRMYGPGPEAQNGDWSLPPIKPAT
ncbi:MAG: DUF1254 domain-containing protein [Solirubrobacteraceae bacterium]